MKILGRELIGCRDEGGMRSKYWIYYEKWERPEYYDLIGRYGERIGDGRYSSWGRYYAIGVYYGFINIHIGVSKIYTLKDVKGKIRINRRFK